MANLSYGMQPVTLSSPGVGGNLIKLASDLVFIARYCLQAGKSGSAFGQICFAIEKADLFVSIRAEESGIRDF